MLIMPLQIHQYIVRSNSEDVSQFSTIFFDIFIIRMTMFNHSNYYYTAVLIISNQYPRGW